MISSDQFKKNCNIPNLLSIMRIIIIVPFINYFLKDDYIMAFLTIIVSGLSDMFDGLIARKLNQITKLGTILDPIADKLTLAAVVVCLCMKIPVITPIILVLLVKELLMLLAGAVLIKKNIAPPSAQWYGKLATIVFYVFVAVIVLLKAVWGIEITALTITLMSITVALMLFAFIKYFLLFLTMIKTDSDKSTSNAVK